MTDNSPSDNVTSLEMQRILSKASELDAVHQPERDLWPDIESKLSPKAKAKYNWMPYALAASVLLAFISVSFNGYLLTQTKPVLTASNTNISDIERPYILARTALLEEIVTNENQLSPEMREVLDVNLEIIDKALYEIRQELEVNPNDAYLIDALITTREKELELFRQLTVHRYVTI